MQLEQKGLMIKQKRKKKPGRWLDPKRTADWMKTLSDQLESGELGYKVTLIDDTIYDLSEDFESEADFVHAITRGAIKRRGSRFESFLPGIDSEDQTTPVVRWRHIRGLGRVKFTQICDLLEAKGYEIRSHMKSESPPREFSEEFVGEKLDRIEQKLQILIDRIGNEH